jgi:hypothetical protein
MPCNSDYMNPTHKEVQLRETAILYKYALRCLGLDIPPEVSRAAGDMYCSVDFVSDLCNLLSDMTEEQRVSIIYNPYEKPSRRLADWWEEHQKADRLREEREKEAARQAAVREEALSRLTPEQIKALGLGR